MGSRTTGHLRRGAAVAAKKAELGFCVPFLCWRLSEKVGFGEGEERNGAFWTEQE